MSKYKWTRQDVVNWMQTVNECGCEEEDHSIHGTTMFKSNYEPHILRRQVDMSEGADTALCPDTYSKVADVVCQDPHAVLELLKPIMQQIGVGCPQSFAKAIADVFFAGQDMGIIRPFNTE
jgi:hypothetical protein